MLVRDTGIEPVGAYLERPWQVPFAREIMWHQLSTPLDPRAYASFTSRFAITLLTACNSLKPNGPGLCTVPRRVRGERRSGKKISRPSGHPLFVATLAHAAPASVPSAVGDSVHGCTEPAPGGVVTAQRRQPGPRQRRTAGQSRYLL